MSLLVFRIILKQIVSDIVNWILRFYSFLSKRGKSLQNKRNHGLIEIRSNGKRLKTVFC